MRMGTRRNTSSQYYKKDKYTQPVNLKKDTGVMKIIVSEKLKGEIVLPTVGYALNPGQMVNIPNDKADATDIVIAIQRGFIEKIEDILEDKFEEKKEDNEDNEVEEEEKVVEKLDLTKPEEVDTEGKESNMMSYNLETKEMLDKNNSRTTAMDRISSKDAEPVQTGDVDFSEEENPKPKTKPKAKKKSKKASKKRKTVKNVKKKLKEAAAEVSKSIKPVGEVKEEPKPNDLVFDNSKDIGFVDQEQDKKRIQQHPVLSKINKDNSD